MGHKLSQLIKTCCPRESYIPENLIRYFVTVFIHGTSPDVMSIM